MTDLVCNIAGCGPDISTTLCLQPSESHILTNCSESGLARPDFYAPRFLPTRHSNNSRQSAYILLSAKEASFLEKRLSVEWKKTDCTSPPSGIYTMQYSLPFVFPNHFNVRTFQDIFVSSQPSSYTSKC